MQREDRSQQRGSVVMESDANEGLAQSQMSGMLTMKPLLSAKDVACLFGINELTLANWRCAGVGPAYIKIGSAVRYTRQAIEQYLTEQTIIPSVREDAANHAHRP
jgi:predicted DNA-binding transcriptional regulator AlpA